MSSKVNKYYKPSEHKANVQESEEQHIALDCRLWKTNKSIFVSRTTVKLVTVLTKNAMHEKGGTSEYCAVITLDEQNASNSANYKFLATIDVGSNLNALLDSYLTGRRLWHDIVNEPGEYIVPTIVKQRSELYTAVRSAGLAK